MHACVCVCVCVVPVCVHVHVCAVCVCVCVCVEGCQYVCVSVVWLLSICIWIDTDFVYPCIALLP